ncbi:hypothetical protein EAX61_15575 [Dokdonia sinensis]|uniref:Uncharacterized protein n=1 Tax=Dokdonia sinensis TaxID=2479847 RepID=A0A3M0FUK0_9FLAO|nr:hypothetical protein [Dokdonia sinensis]RMB56188.1 hypothetical protein EAX61_15575 [Dokdonia sinensis]
MKLIIISITAMLLFLGCGSNNATNEEPVIAKPLEETSEIIEEVEEIAEEVVEKKDYSSLIFSVQLGISKQRPNWVLFENGTYAIFKKSGSDTQMTANAKDLLRDVVDENKVQGKGTVKKAQFAKGWVVTFGNSGIYNYVDHKTLPEGINSKTIILERARLNVARDYNDLNVVKVHK